MNIKYLEALKNKYLVLDDKDNISLVNSEEDIKETLNLENQLEEKIQVYEKYCKLKNKALENLEGIKKCNNLLYILIILIYIYTCSQMGWLFAIVPSLLAFSTEKLLSVYFFKTKKYNEKILKFAEAKKEKYNIELENIENKLKQLKQKNNYKKENIIDLIEQNTVIDKEETIDKNLVKKLVKKPDVK